MKDCLNHKTHGLPVGHKPTPTSSDMLSSVANLVQSNFNALGQLNIDAKEWCQFIEKTQQLLALNHEGLRNLYQASVRNFDAKLTLQVTTAEKIV